MLQLLRFREDSVKLGSVISSLEKRIILSKKSNELKK